MASPTSSIQIEETSIGTRVGRRILLLFSLASLAPLSVVVWLSVRGLAVDLRALGESNLDALGRDLADGIHGRCELLEERLGLWAHELAVNRSQAVRGSGGPDSAVVVRGFLSLGTLDDPARLPDEVRRLIEERLKGSDGGALLLPLAPRRLIVARRVETEGEPTIVWGDVDTAWLWWGSAAEAMLPPEIAVTVFDPTGSPLLATNDELAHALPESIRIPGVLFGSEQVTGPGVDHQVRYWRLPLHMFAGSPNLAVALSQPRGAHDRIFGRQIRTLVLAGIFALLLVALLSVVQIRRTLDPLSALSRGLAGMASGDLGRRVSIESRDEFQQLADAFNRMAGRLEHQFESLRAANTIDRAILSTTDPRQVFEIALQGIGQLLPTDQATIRIFGEDQDVAYRFSARRPGGVERHLEAPMADGVRFLTHAILAEQVSEPCGWWPELRVVAPTSVIRAPVGDRGFVAVAHRGSEPYEDRHVGRLAALGDQLAVALTNASLIENLSKMHQGALVAFARAVDLKSPWTGGHSERVARSARELGTILGLSQERRDRLYRAGLLHDIGKIGVPDEVLDKPGKLSALEMLQVQDHVRLGATLLQAIPGFEEILPPVWQHHERWDGTGYPNRLAGEDISLDGRILGLVDVYDALTSPRPYRAAMTNDEALEIIESESGKHFDPDLVPPFLDLCARWAAESRTVTESRARR